MSYLLVLILVIPLIGAIIGAMLPSDRAARGWALGVSLATLAVTVVFMAMFEYELPQGSWATPAVKARVSVQGADGLGHLLHRAHWLPRPPGVLMRSACGWWR